MIHTLDGEPATPLSQQTFEIMMDRQRAFFQKQERLGLEILNVAREALDNLTEEPEPGNPAVAPRARVSAPGEAEPGEFYVEIDGLNFVVKVESL